MAMTALRPLTARTRVVEIEFREIRRAEPVECLLDVIVTLIKINERLDLRAVLEDGDFVVAADNAEKFVADVSDLERERLIQFVIPATELD